jgi:hypothetical protein
MLSLHIVIALYHYRFGYMCTHYPFVLLSLQETFSVIASLSYRFWNIGTVIAYSLHLLEYWNRYRF